MKRGASGINCLIGLDKPYGMTSHDCVSAVRRIVGEKRVGHAGTLDPAATGVLIIGIGQATRLCGLLSDEGKAYEARVVFGLETDTDDAEGRPVRSCEVEPRLSEEGPASAVAASLVGVQDQVPPAYSAISVDGKRAYKSAREGEAVELAPRRIEVYSSELLRTGEQDGSIFWDLRLSVSKGTYIRAIARDLGRSLGCAAHLGALRRVSAGKVGISDCLGLDELEKRVGDGKLADVMLDPALASGLAVRTLTDAELEDVLCGRAIPADGMSDERVCLVHETRCMGIWQLKGSRYAPLASFTLGIDGVRP